MLVRKGCMGIRASLNTVQIVQVTASCYLGFAQNRGNQEAMTRMPRGQCILPTDDAGRILDRLAGLEQVIRPDDIQQALSATGRVSTRSCVLTSEVILWVVLAMGLLTDLPIRQVFKHARRLRVGEKWGITIIGAETYAKDQPVIGTSLTTTIMGLLFPRMPYWPFL